MLCVRPGVFEVRARPLRCRSELMSEDFPTFERPRNAISGPPVGDPMPLLKSALYKFRRRDLHWFRTEFSARDLFPITAFERSLSAIITTARKKANQKGCMEVFGNLTRTFFALLIFTTINLGVAANVTPATHEHLCVRLSRNQGRANSSRLRQAPGAARGWDLL